MKYPFNKKWKERESIKRKWSVSLFLLGWFREEKEKKKILMGPIKNFSSPTCEENGGAWEKIIETTIRPQKKWENMW